MNDRGLFPVDDVFLGRQRTVNERDFAALTAAIATGAVTAQSGL
jgi:hypothetical protein